MRPLAGGNRNVVLRTEGLEQDIVFKSTSRSAAALAWLTPVMDAAEAAGFVVPRLIPSDRGHLSEAGWTAEPFLEGPPLDPKRMATLAPKIDRFQKLAAPLPQRPGFLSAREFLHKTKGGDIDLAAMPDALSAACRTAFAALDDRTTIIHGDLTPSNVLIAPDGRITLIDWDEARRDHPTFDLAAFGQTAKTEARARLAWEIACCWKTEPERARDLASRHLARGTARSPNCRRLRWR